MLLNGLSHLIWQIWLAHTVIFWQFIIHQFIYIYFCSFCLFAAGRNTHNTQEEGGDSALLPNTLSHHNAAKAHCYRPTRKRQRHASTVPTSNTQSSSPTFAALFFSPKSQIPATKARLPAHNRSAKTCITHIATSQIASWEVSAYRAV